MSTETKRAILKDTAQYTFANYIVQAIGIVNSIVLRRFLGPAGMGVWSILQVILGYCGYASFGTTKAMARDYPFLRGKGEHAKAEELKDLTLTFSMLMSIIPCAAIVLYLVLRGAGMEPVMKTGLVFLAVFLFVQRFYDLLITLLRSDKKFGLLSQMIVLNALGGLAVSCFFVRNWNVYGLFAGTALTTCGCLIFILKNGGYQFHYYWNGSRLKNELKLGIPLVAAGFLSEFLRGMDELIIAKRLGFYEVGLYSIATMVNSYAFALPMMFQHVWFPHLQEQFGRTGHAEGIKNYLLTPLYVLTIIMPLLAGFAIYLMPLLAHFFLPKFVPGLPSMKVYITGTYFLILAQFSMSFLITLDKYIVNVVILAAAVLANYLLNNAAINLGWGLPGVAGATAASFAFFGLSTYVIALRHFTSAGELFREVSKPLILFFSYFGGIFVIDYAVHTKNLVAETGIKVSIFLVYSIIFLFLLERRTGLIKMGVNLIQSRFSKTQD